MSGGSRPYAGPYSTPGAHDGGLSSGHFVSSRRIFDCHLYMYFGIVLNIYFI
nr:MAG TPA: hypothetical protein [Caudoviricetes sp.]